MDYENKEIEYQDRFSRLMFGAFPPPQTPTREQVEREYANPSASAQEVDFVQLMENVNAIVSSLEKLKPLIKKISPLMDLFKK